MNRKANIQHSLDWFSSILPLGESQKHFSLAQHPATQSWDVTASPAHFSLSDMLSSFTACPCSHHTLPQTMRFHDYFSPLRAFTAPRSSLHTGRWELKVSLVLPHHTHPSSNHYITHWYLQPGSISCSLGGATVCTVNRSGPSHAWATTQLLE